MAVKLQFGPKPKLPANEHGFREVIGIDPETGEDNGLVLAYEADADPVVAQMVIDAPVDEGHGSEGHLDGRSGWKWFRLQNGDLILGCWPHGETYEATEMDEGRP